MDQPFKFIAATLVCVLVASVASWMAVYGFWIGIWLFHSVAVARILHGFGAVFLLPARGLFACLGGALDETTPMFDPILYVVANGVLIGLACGFAGRRWLRNKHSPG